MPESLLQGLDVDQRAVARATRGRVVVVAAAGSGKTRAIAHRIAYAVASNSQQAEKGLALSFTTRAAGELRGRLSQLGLTGVHTATFHSAALRQLSYFWPRVLGGPAWKILSTKTATLEQAARAAGVDVSLAQRRIIAGEIEWAKSSGLDASGYLAQRSQLIDVDASDVVNVWSAYQDHLTTKNLIDFEDVLSLTLGMFQQRPDVVEEVRRRYHWFTVDEFQDVTPLQHALLDQWLGERGEICIVGDPAQTIYSFAGAASNFLTDFRKTHPDATFVELNRTYRCAPAIVNAANSLLQSEAPEFRTGLTMASQSNESGAVLTSESATDADEAAVIAREIAQLLDGGVDPREIAILVRLNSMTVPLERALDTAQIAYSLKGATRFFERREVKSVLLALRAESYSHDSTSVVDAVSEVAQRFGWSPVPSGTSAEARSVWEALSALVSLAEDLCRHNPDVGMTDFFEEVARLTLAQHEPSPSAITLSTIHAAKGLEWDYVFIPGVNESVLPYFMAQTPAAIAEERRLFYVALTRARKDVRISWTSARNGQSLAPSRFVHDIGAVTSDLPRSTVVFAAPAPEAVVAHVQHCRLCGKGLTLPSETAVMRCRTCPAPDVDDMFAQLRQWRDDYAQDNELLPWLVLTEVSLTALAELKPQTESDLRRIHGLSESKVDALANNCWRC